MSESKQKETVRVSIVEDDERLRGSLIVLLEGTPGFRCVSAYSNAEAAIADIPSKSPDVILMDINLPGVSGIEAVRKLKSSKPDLLVLMLTVYEDSNKIFQALQAGASGYLLKMTPPDEILSSIREVHGGGAPMSAQIARKVVQSFHAKPGAEPDLDLTEREEEILQALSGGGLYKEIASDLNISVDTVHNHLRRIYQKLHVRSRTEAVVKYLKR